MDLHTVRAWYLRESRALPWREQGTSPWAILVSEVMLQQTPVARVIPAWREWMARWPDPQALAGAALSEALRQWDRLGYPRRAKHLHQCAVVISRDYAGEVPQQLEQLLALPGIGDYTARAVACFAFGQPHPVVDTNVKRVIARAADAVAAAGHWSVRVGMEKVAEACGDELSDEDYCLTQRGLMELGALVCTARQPRCGQCPLAQVCQWRQAGFPVDPLVLPRRQARYEGSDRQARGVVLEALRNEPHGAWHEELLSLWPRRSQLLRALQSLIDDGLVEELADTPLRYRLSGGSDPGE